MVSGALGDGVSSAIANAETLTRTTIRMEITTSGSIEAGITNNAGVGGDEASIGVRDDNDLAAMHALANVVICLSRKPNVQARQNKSSEGLPGASMEVDINLALEPRVAMGSGDVPGEHSTGASVRIFDVKVGGGLSIIVTDYLLHICRLAYLAVQIRAKFVDVNVRILGDQLPINAGTKEGTVVLAVRNAAKELVNVDPITLGNAFNLLGALLQKIGTPDEILELGITQVGHQLSNFLGNKLEEVDDVLGSTWEFLSKLLFLTGYSDGACVKMADAGHDAALGNHGNRAETKLFGSHHSSDGNVPPSTDTSINANGHAVTETVVEKGRMGLGKTKLPRAACILD